MESRDDRRSCGSQLLTEGEPNNEWGLEDLGSYAQIQYRQIIEGEKLLTPSYWRLGHALTLARKAFVSGQWSRYMNEMGIDKTRASKAWAIYRTFPKPEDVARLTVEGAYRQRQRKRGDSSKKADGDIASTRDAQRLRKSVSRIAQRTGDVIHDAAFAPPEVAAGLIPAVRKAVSELQQLLQFLEEQAAAADVSDDAEPTISSSQAAK